MIRHDQVPCLRRNRRQRSSSHGFTLVELLVVITIIGVLMAMLIPVIGRVREYAHRVTCMNNASQIGLAMTIYATSKGKMPPTMSTWQDTSGTYTLGWAEALMAQLGRADLVPNPPTFTEAMLRASKPYIAPLVCPSDPTKVGVTGVGPLSYVPNGGGFPSYSYSPPDWNQNGAWNYAVQNTNGQTLTNRTLEYIGRHDGTSTTISHSENLDAVSWIASSSTTEYAQAILWDASTQTMMNQNEGSSSNATARPSSNHPGGAVVGFCDGSVKFIQQTMAYNIYATLMTSYGQQASPAGTAFTTGNAYYNLQVIPLDSSTIPTN